jgi:hypothetical protein
MTTPDDYACAECGAWFVRIARGRWLCPNGHGRVRLNLSVTGMADAQRARRAQIVSDEIMRLPVAVRVPGTRRGPKRWRVGETLCHSPLGWVRFGAPELVNGCVIGRTMAANKWGWRYFQPVEEGGK